MRKTVKTLSVLAVVGFMTTLQAAQNEARAGSELKIYVNDVDVTGLTNQEFKNCTVTFDSKGNVHVRAPGYKVKRLDSSEGGESSSASSTTVTTKQQKKTTEKYFLVTEQNNGGKVWDKYTLLLNGTVVKSFESSDGVILEDISKHVDKGTNQAVITASKAKNYPGGSKSYWYRVILGKGHVEDKKIVIDETIGRLTRKGSDADPESKSFTFKAK